ncbi:MAG: EFR1 family ferrodoxin [Lachnospiraceae bacterium]|nr:EFR1 family ferrodoxin [Lachnospiraceae bacterium]
MRADKVTGVFFSPTGNTAKVVSEIGRTLAGDTYRELDWTKPDNRGQKRHFKADEVVIIGVPVYRGRVPELAAKEIEELSGEETPAVILVTYGNRMIEDAMLELKDLMEQQGFLPFACASFSGQHSFNKEISYNRPDEKDLRIAREFAGQIERKLESFDKEKVGFVVPGNRPYKKVGPMSAMPFYPQTDMKCIYCMLCSKYCPAEAFSFSNPKDIDPNKCIRCTACIRVCPVQAKSMTPDTFDSFVKKITTPSVLRRKEPWFFV